MKNKKYFLVILFVLVAILVNAQNTEDNRKSNYNELKINGLYLVIGAFDITYEYTLNEEAGLGLNLFLPLDKDIKDDIQYYISPYYRMYFGNKYAAGFFVEGFGMLNSVKSNEIWLCDTCFGHEPEETITDFALGIGFGGKWVTNRGFIGELNIGLGRNLFNSDQGEELISKAGITLGYRF